MEISLSSYSIRNEWEPLKKNKIDAMINICQDLGIKNVELLDSEFTPENLSDEVKTLADHGIKVFAIAVCHGVLAKPDEVEKVLKESQVIIHLAHSVGVKNIRFFVGDGPLMAAFPPMDDFDEEEWEDYHEQMDDAVNFTLPVLEPMLKLAEELDINIGLESHGSYSSNYVYMQALNKRIHSKNFGWILDVGNFVNDDMRWKAVEEVKARTLYVHAKSYEFDEKGMETKVDYPKVCQILSDAGFNGVWTIEFEGKMNGILGVHKTNELLKYSFARSTGNKYSINLNIPSGEDLIKKYNSM